MKSIVEKACYVRTHNKDLSKQVAAIAAKAGFNIQGLKHVMQQLVFGKWDEWVEDNNVYDLHAWDESVFKVHPHWPRFDAKTQMDEIIAHFEGRPPYDETPLPHDMNPELAKEIQKRFNLSPDQWDAIPPLAREALSGVQVVTETVKVQMGVSMWKPLSESTSRNGRTVVITRNPGDATGNVSAVATAYRENETWYGDGHREIGWSPTHWAPLPGDLDAEDGEDDSEDEEESQEDNGNF